MDSDKHQGFTLIELSIVLVIIGLVIGGVLVGKDLIIGAQIKRLMGGIEEYKIAAHTFKLKYGGLPGDITNASDFWTVTITSDLPSCVNGSSPHTTCNADGNGIFYSYKDRLFFNHLAMANLISKQDDFSFPSLPNYNGIYTIYNWQGSEWYFNGIKPGNYFHIGQENFWGDRGPVPYMEALQFDTKYDDGNFGTGKIRSEWSAVAGTCMSSNANSFCKLAIPAGF